MQSTGANHTLIWFGIGFVAAAVIILCLLVLTRTKTPKTDHKEDSSPEPEREKVRRPLSKPPPGIVQVKV